MKVERENLADASATNNLHAAQHNRVKSGGVNHAQSASAGAGGCHHSLTLLRRLCHRLFDQHVRARLQSLDADLRMERGRSQHVDHIHAGSQ